MFYSCRTKKRLYICREQKQLIQFIMKTLNDILNSDFFKNEILDYDKETLELQKDGWSRNDIKGMANFIIKNS